MERLLFSLALLALAFSSGEAVAVCFECTSLSTQDCADPFASRQLSFTSCDLQKTQQFYSALGFDIPSRDQLGPDDHWTCLKLKYLDDKGQSHTVRGCHIPDSDTCKKTPRGMDVTYCGVCDLDNCNGAGRLGGVATIFYLLLPSVVALKAVAA